MKLKFIVIIGLPGSGKSSLCEKITKSLQSRNQIHAVHLEFDRHVCVETSKFRQSRLDFLNSVENSIDIFLKTLKLNFPLLDDKEKEQQADQSKDEFILLFDDNMYYRSMRYEVLKIARRFHCPPDVLVQFGVIYLKVDKNSCLQRNSERANPSSRVPDHVINEMNEKIEEPGDLFENESNTLVLTDDDGHNLDISKCLSFFDKLPFVESQDEIDRRNIEMEQMKERSRVETSNDIFHQCEIYLRKIVGEELRKMSDKEKTKQMSASLQQIKKKTMEEVKLQPNYHSIDDAVNFASSLFYSYLDSEAS